MTNKKAIFLIAATLSLSVLGCSQAEPERDETQDYLEMNFQDNGMESRDINEERQTEREADSVKNGEEHGTVITPTAEVIELEQGLSVVQYTGDYGFEQFLKQGGASADGEVLKFLSDSLFPQLSGVEVSENGFGCSTLSVKNQEGESLFGRNFDWNQSNAWIILSEPKDGYSSISTVNMDFIGAGGVSLERIPEEAQIAAALYAPLDGMNEMGFCVSVNMIQDSSRIEQDTEKPDLTTTTAVRLLLNRASTVEEALELLGQYDLHGSMGFMVHFALADKDGHSVAVEYVDNEMTVTDTPVVTNFYLASGEKNGIGTAQSHTRYEILMDCLKEQETMDMETVRDCLDRVSKDNFGEFESTEWSIVFNQSSGEVRYYHRENYGNSYIFYLK